MPALKRFQRLPPVGVFVIAVMCLLASIFSAGVLISDYKLWNSDQYGPVATWLAFLVLISAALGIGIYRLKNWARIALLCLSVVILLNSFFLTRLSLLEPESCWEHCVVFSSFTCEQRQLATSLIVIDTESYGSTGLIVPVLFVSQRPHRVHAGCAICRNDRGQKCHEHQQH